MPYCHDINQMRKYKGYPNFDTFRRYFNKNYWKRLSTKLYMTCNIKPLKPILAKIVPQHGKKSFLKSHFSSFANQAAWQLMEVEVSELYLNSLWKSFFHYILSDQLEIDGSENIDSFSAVACEQHMEQLIYQWQGRNFNFCHWKNEGKSLRDVKYTLFLAIRPFTSPWEECSDYKYGAYMCFPRKSQICYILGKNTKSTYCNFQQILVKYYFSCSKY